ncbi:iron ABC transporter permease [Phycicoccus sp. 3266]|uniref:FecCD family ABC transporter permease n=1 Tax=Phycicoccus sp. 3266 TaxID=2817751 RepID=UPI00285D4CAC|nr:iron ABC transporter permease [Phycicoccus sp. 3266]MDR6862699.1 iron complex transport system permease protein [Phycicoccus sp. 3266]
MASGPRTRRRALPPAAVVVAGAVLLATACVLSLAVGARPVGWSTLFDALSGFDPSLGDHLVVQSRVPRTLTGLLAGTALGLAGAAMQGVTRNPLADPGILGVNAGAALAIVVALFLFGIASPAGYLWFAFAGAAAAAVVAYAVASLGREGATPVKLALAGAALSAVLASVMNALLVLSQQTLDQFRFWQVGSLSGATPAELRTVLPFAVVGALVVVGSGRWLNGLALGDDLARGLGQRVALTRAVTAAGVVVLVGSATALAGPIAFVGLVVPHMVRALVGGDHRWLLPLSALLAPALLLAADVAGRVVAPPSEVQAGIMTAVVGAPVFIALVARRRVAAL